MTARRADAPDRGHPWDLQPVPGKSSRRPVNDVELIADVIRTASTRGYVLIGPAQRVFVWVDAKKKGGHVEKVPGYEQDAVHQLLGSRHLRIGGTHIVCYRDREGPANSVLVSKAAQAMIARWSAYRPMR
jgi:hypothetical protein